MNQRMHQRKDNPDNIALRTELETYQRELGNLLPQAGMYALISGDALLDIFDTYDDALKTGYKTVGLKPFLVKKIQAIEQARTITRLFVPCPI